MIGVEGTNAEVWARRIAPDSWKPPVSVIAKDKDRMTLQIVRGRYALSS